MYNQDVFMYQNKAGSGYDYVGCHTDDLLIVVKKAQEILDSLMKIYEVSKPRPPVYHLGCDYSKVFDEGEEFWCIGSSTHIKEACIFPNTIIFQFHGLMAGSQFCCSFHPTLTPHVVQRD